MRLRCARVKRRAAACPAPESTALHCIFNIGVKRQLALIANGRSTAPDAALIKSQSSDALLAERVRQIAQIVDDQTALIAIRIGWP